MEKHEKKESQERDLMVNDVFRTITKMFWLMLLTCSITITGFFGYVVYKDHQHNKLIITMTDKYNEFINSFDFYGETVIDATDGGNAGLIKNGGTINNGENNNKKIGEEEER